MNKLKDNVFVKMGVIVLLILILLIPTAMVRDLIREREWVQQEAIAEVSDKWSKGQTITGPYLAIPYDKYIKQYSQKDSTNKIVKIKEWLYFLPKQLTVNGNLNPEKRTRGIYEVVVYDSEFDITGTFDPISTDGFDINPRNIHFENAKINVGITDLRGIEKQIDLKWNNENISFNSGLSSVDLIQSGINAPVKVSQNDSLGFQFSLQLNLKGSQHIYFNPLGKTTDIQLKSNWNTPSFDGAYLPDERTISEDGFSANWNILHLNRNFPQVWSGSDYSIKKSTFGTNLLLPVDNYKKSDRVAKYAVLFLVLTFLVFFFVEVLNRVFIHPIQYLLVGIAIIVFYTLLLAFGEHMLFNLAYFLACILTLGLITAYTAAILKSKKLSLLVCGILTVLYSFIFTIIQLENYALLIGSIGVFLILAIVMFFSRKIDWYQIRLGEPKN